VTSRVALVTGAARGIGAATVRRLAADGWAVMAVDSCGGPDAVPYPLPSADDLDALVGGLPDAGSAVADVRDRQALDTVVADVLERWGRLDAVVAAAGVVAGGRPLWDTAETDVGLMWDVNARGVWNVAAASIPAMLAGPDPSGCRFVAVASAAGHHGLFHLAAYTASKHATVGIVRGLAADLVGTGIAAIAVSPGSTRTAMLEQTAELFPDADVADMVRHQLLQRVLEPDELAATIVFCCSAAGAALNGSVVHADGGFRG